MHAISAQQAKCQYAFGVPRRSITKHNMHGICHSYQHRILGCEQKSWSWPTVWVGIVVWPDFFKAFYGPRICRCANFGVFFPAAGKNPRKKKKRPPKTSHKPRSCTIEPRTSHDHTIEPCTSHTSNDHERWNLAQATIMHD
jgi:hypothetical protein